MIYVTKAEIEGEVQYGGGISRKDAVRRAEARKVARMIEGLPGDTWADHDLRAILEWLVQRAEGRDNGSV